MLHDLAMAFLPPLRVSFDLHQGINAMRERMVPWYEEVLRKQRAQESCDEQLLRWRALQSTGTERRGATKRRRPVTMALQPWQRRRKRR